MIPRSDVIG